MARRVGWTTGYRTGQDRIPHNQPGQGGSGMLRPRPARRPTGSTTLWVQRSRRRH